MELCGIKVPQGLDGQSFAPLLQRSDKVEWKDYAYSFFHDGISVRTPDCRLTYYQKKNEKWVELYRYSEDCMERENIADKNPEVIQKLLGRHSILKNKLK